jgi:hypothetical protein
MSLTWSIALGIVLAIGLLYLIQVLGIALIVAVGKIMECFGDNLKYVLGFGCACFLLLAIGIGYLILRPNDARLIYNHPTEAAFFLIGATVVGGIFMYLLPGDAASKPGPREDEKKREEEKKSIREMTWKEAWLKSSVSEKLFLTVLALLILVFLIGYFA